MKKRVPYGIASFRRLITEGYYFIDKTRYIRELENFMAPVFLRSRRFGKSLWCSILEHYYDVRFEAEFDKLFGATDIGKNPTESHNKYLVLRFDFSKVSVSSNYNELERNFNNVVFRALKDFLHHHEQYGDFSDALKAENAAEPQLFTGVEFTDPPPSWTELVRNTDHTHESYAIGVWGALEEYDWVELIRATE